MSEGEEDKSKQQVQRQETGVTSKSRSDEAALLGRGYVMGRKLGSGAFSTVRKALFKHGEEEILLACKVIHRRKLPKEFVTKFFPRELQILMVLDDPNIVRAHSIMERKDNVYIFMEYCENGDVLEYIQREGRLRESQANFWSRQLFSAIHYLQKQYICHRDLKCENLLLTKRYNLKIADFGFARFCIEDEDPNKRVISETYCGSASYSPPQIIRGVPYDPLAADVWSCGVIVFIMVCGTFPFDSGNLKKMLRAQEKREWDFRSRVKPNLSEEIKDIVSRLLEPIVQKRIKIDEVMDHDWLTDAMLRRLIDEDEAS
ncbi:unnamed protein product [Cyprideis torosa]|uniref:Protein kinase domain-containing protein n=1 Tax=Cyprideis torosa TaxID=163714 RepID=A0A7R8W6E4_9CRUS|nr:unnamed protein product [Cyprideis torosa]CAG0886441.1 unnamed protein product [Cyprideis torosa]